MVSDLAELLAAAADGRLGDGPRFATDAAVTVVCASEGYPTRPRTGDAIHGWDAAAAEPGVTVYAAGVTRDAAGTLRTAGGRVLAVTGIGADLTLARDRAYRGVGCLRWPGLHHRGDIASVPTSESPTDVEESE